MNRLLPLLTLVALPFCSCAVLKKDELAELRTRKVSPALVGKLERGEALFPSDVIELSQHRMSNQRIVHYIRKTGIASPLSAAEVERMRAARVSGEIISLLERESVKLQEDRAAVGEPGTPF